MLLFLFASVSKWLAFRTFINDIDNQPFPNSFTPWIVYLLPPLEVLITLALMFERTRTAGLYGSLILMSAFSLYTAAVLLHFFKYVPCSCGGIIKNLSWPAHLFLNLFFVAISIAGIILRKNRFKDGPTKQVMITG
jgi:hypothetical protein